MKNSFIYKTIIISALITILVKVLPLYFLTKYYYYKCKTKGC